MFPLHSLVFMNFVLTKDQLIQICENVFIWTPVWMQIALGLHSRKDGEYSCCLILNGKNANSRRKKAEAPNATQCLCCNIFFTW